MAHRADLSKNLAATVYENGTVQLEKRNGEVIVNLRLTADEFKDLLALNTRYKQGRVKNNR